MPRLNLVHVQGENALAANKSRPIPTGSYLAVLRYIIDLSLHSHC